MKFIPILIFLAISSSVSGQQPLSKRANTVAFVKQKFTSGIKHTIGNFTGHIRSAKYDLTFTGRIKSKVKNHRHNLFRRHTHRRQVDVQVVMHFSAKKFSTSRARKKV